MRIGLSCAIVVLLCGALCAQPPATNAPEPPAMRMHIEDQTLHRLSGLLYGHFLELPGGDELGPEAALAEDGVSLRADVLEQLRELRPTSMRWPGGAVVEYVDFRRFLPAEPDGWHEQPYEGQRVALSMLRFLELCRELGALSIICLPTRPAMLGRRSLEEAAREAAGIVAFCNAPLDADLPDDLMRWARLRETLGHAQPFNVTHWQIGNEIWMYRDGQLKKHRPEIEDRDAHQVRVIQAYVNAMRRVDPNLVLITDAMNPRYNQLLRQRVGDGINLLSEHKYRPWKADHLERDGNQVPAWQAPLSEQFDTWMTAPDVDPQTGMAYWKHELAAERAGYRLALTEWNFNAFGKAIDGEGALGCFWARGLGAALFLHGILRSGEHIELATQSMMLGNYWAINAIRVNPADPSVPAQILPSGAVVAFYQRHAGDRLLKSRTSGQVYYSTPWKIGSLGPASRVARVDALATATDDHLIVHLISRHYAASQEVVVDLSSFGMTGGTAQMHLLFSEGDNAHGLRQAAIGTRIEDLEIDALGQLRLSLPAQAIAAVRIRR